jgi:Flp pilus assembly protein TadD
LILTLAPTVTSEDSGELIAAAWHFGIPHPPGYPLWTMVCGVFLRVFAIGSVAWRANLFSALCSSLAAGLAYGAIRELHVSRAAAAGASLVWVLARWSWSQSVITEVYPLNSALTAAVLWCVLRWARTGRPGGLIVGSLLMGLGMSNHHLIALAGLALVIWAFVHRPALVRRWRLGLLCVLMFMLGLLPYLYLPLRAREAPPVNWGDPSTPQRFWEHVTRHQYGTVGPMPVAEPRSPTRVAAQLGYLATSVIDDLSVPLSIVALIGIGLLAFRDRSSLVLVLLWFMLTGVVFVLMANYNLDRMSRWAMRVFFIPISLGLAIPIAVALDAGGRLLLHRAGAGRRLAVTGAAALPLAAALIQATVHWRHCNYSNYWYAYDHAGNLLHCMMPRAILFPSGDHNTFPLVHARLVEGKRPDVEIADMYGYLRPGLYADRPADSAESPEAWLLKTARRPAYYTTKKQPPVAAARFVPAGILYHLLPDGYALEDRDLLAGCRYRNLTSPTVIDFGASNILADYEFFSGLHELQSGRGDAALIHFGRATDYGFGIKELYNNIGSALSEHGRFADAIPYYIEAARLDRRYLLPRRNLVRLYRSTGRLTEARAELERTTTLFPEDPRAFSELGFLLRDHFSDRVGAQGAWRRSLQLDPEQPEVRNALRGLRP